MTERRTAIVILGLVAVIAVLGDVLLLSTGHNPPGGLLAIAGASVGALATLVTSARGPDEC